MITETHLEFVRNSGTKLGRFLVGLLFFVSGLSILFISGPAGTVAWFDAIGIPLASITVWLVILVKLVAGGALMIGRYVPHAAAALIIFTLLATAIAHLDFADPTQLTAALKNLAIIGGLLYIMAFGPGGTNMLSKENV